MLATVIGLSIGMDVSTQAQMRDSYLEAARTFRNAASTEDDPVLRDGYLRQAEEMERNARALESDAPAFRFDPKQDQIQQELNRQLNNIQFQSPSARPHRSCASPPCAMLVK